MTVALIGGAGIDSVQRTQIEDDIKYVDLFGKVISKEAHAALRSDYSVTCVSMDSVGNGVTIYTRFDGIVGKRTWTLDDQVVHNAFMTFRINADETGDLLHGCDSLEEARRVHNRITKEERTFQTLLRGTTPAVRSGAL